MGAKPNAKKQGVISQRDAKGQCVRCGCEVRSTGGRRRLGCCDKCYRTFRDEMIRLSLDERKQARFKAGEIRKGHIIGNRGGRRIDVQPKGDA